MGRRNDNRGTGRFIQKMVTGNSVPRAAVNTTWSDTDENGNEKGDAIIRTVSFNLLGQDLSIPPIKCDALLEFAVSGNSVSRRVSVVNGASISGVCEALNVKLQDQTTDGGVPANLGVDYDVNIIVAPGTRANGRMPPIWTPINPVTGQYEAIVVPFALVPIVVPIPDGLGATMVFVTVDDPGTAPGHAKLLVEHVGSGGTILKGYDPRNYPDGVPLSPGTTQLNLLNTDAASTAAVLGIDFGIDG